MHIRDLWEEIEGGAMLFAVVAGAVALFWNIWNLIAGSIPHGCFLGYCATRSWDVLALPTTVVLMFLFGGTLNRLVIEDWTKR